MKPSNNSCQPWRACRHKPLTQAPGQGGGLSETERVLRCAMQCIHHRASLGAADPDVIVFGVQWTGRLRKEKQNEVRPTKAGHEWGKTSSGTMGWRGRVFLPGQSTRATDVVNARR